MDLTLWKQRKKELKLKYEDISKLSGIPITTIKYIFLGYVQTPRIDTVQAIEKALGIQSADERFAEVDLTADQKVILKKAQEVLDKHGEKGKKLILDFFNVLLEESKG